MSYQRGTNLWFLEPLGVGLWRKLVDLGKFGNKCAMQWVLHTAVGSAAAISVYTSAHTNGALLGINGEPSLLDPAINPLWSTTPIAFAALPAAVIGSSHQPFDRPGPFILLEVNVDVAMERFSLGLWGSGNL